MENTPHLLRKNAQQHANEPAISWKDSEGTWQTDSWDDYYNFCLSISKSLLALGLNTDDKMSIYSYNRREWFGCYMASQMLDGAAVGVYHTCSPEEVEWIVGNSDSKIVFVGNNPMDNGEDEKMPNHRLLKVIDRLDQVETVVMMSGVDTLGHDKCMSWDEFIDKGKDVDDSEVDARIENINPDSTSALIYTSGTTGNPKGVELTHKNWTFEISSLDNLFAFDQGAKYISWLPMAHVFAQAMDNHYWVLHAMHLYVCDNPLEIVDHAKEIKPNLFIGVPRIYEKIYSNLKANIDGKAILKYGLNIPGLSGLLKKKLKEATGFIDTTVAISGAAPINPSILTLFQSIGIPLYEGYGLTENTAGATLNFDGCNKIGTVGKAMPMVEIKIAEDGEVLIKGGNVMKGYYKNPEATADSLKDGWLYTGDLGSIDSEGYVKITGRKKEIYVSSGGKNIAPLVIEETMKSIPLISQCFLEGDGRKYCSAVFTLDVGAILRDKLGMEAPKIPKDPAEQLSVLSEMGKSLSDYTDSDEIFSEIEESVQHLNGQFSNPEQVKKFVILPRDLTVDDGELTPTLKIRRKQIRENWSSEIESMYEDA
tara:strand:- start:539 stop:2320 length:1782 start_codon:yes stop_codon:yes gene_type:complete